MAFKWDDYIDFARELKSETDEAKLRSSISRGYYGVYHKSRVRLGHMSGKYVKHETVVSDLKNSPDIDNGNRLANQLDNLKKERVNADYHSFEAVTPQSVNIFWARLDRYITALKSDS